MKRRRAARARRCGIESSVDGRRAAVKAEDPSARQGLGDRQAVEHALEAGVLGADFLIVVPRDRQRELRGLRQQAAEAEGAEAVRAAAGAAGDLGQEAVLRLGRDVDDQGAGPTSPKSRYAESEALMPSPVKDSPRRKWPPRASAPGKRPSAVGG